jgi:hypothetical protein
VGGGGWAQGYGPSFPAAELFSARCSTHRVVAAAVSLLQVSGAAACTVREGHPRCCCKALAGAHHRRRRDAAWHGSGGGSSGAVGSLSRSAGAEFAAARVPLRPPLRAGAGALRVGEISAQWVELVPTVPRRPLHSRRIWRWRVSWSHAMHLLPVRQVQHRGRLQLRVLLRGLLHDANCER